MSPSTNDSERLSRLLAVGRAVVSELDIDTVLDQVLEVARDLTEARYAAIGVLDSSGTELERFITSGIDDDARRRIGALPHGLGVLGVLIEEPRTLRSPDISKHPKSYGFPAGHPPMRTFLGVPIRVRGAVYGNLYLTEKAEGDFTAADEEAIGTLADWAAIAIDNARAVTAQVLRRSIEASELERTRWARELHDETLQELAGLRVLLSSARPGQSEQAIGLAVEQLEISITGLRHLITELRPAALDEYGLGAALEALVQRVRATSGLDVRAEVVLGYDAGTQQTRHDSEIENTLYRLVQEGLTNAVRHSGAEHVSLNVIESPRDVKVEIVDDGTGFDVDDVGGGFGLIGMRERVELVGGSLRIASRDGQGTTISASVPARRRVGTPRSG